MQMAFIGLGSNLDNPQQQMQTALKAMALLPEVHLIAVSSFYKTKPFGPQDQPDFVNAVAKINTSFAPQALLSALQVIENQQGRTRAEKWGPRTIDLDIILFGQQQLELPHLQIPHPEFAKRATVLYPLFEVAPNLVLPDGRSLKSLLLNVDRTGIELLEMEEMA